MDFLTWYNALEKPEPAFIGLMWQILYPIIFISFSFVFIQALRGKIPKIVALPFVINLVANLIFTPIQFGLRNLTLAALDIFVVWATIIWMIMTIWKHYRLVAIAQLPYLLWVSVATVLQLLITWMNF
jgi:tryptophan-rich sensory protein